MYCLPRAALVRAEVVSLVEVDRVDALQRHELGDVGAVRARLLHRLQLLGRELHVLVLGELVAAHELVPLDHHLVHGAERLLLDAGSALGVEHVEGHICGNRGGVELHGDGDEPEGDGAGPEGMRRHGNTPPVW